MSERPTAAPDPDEATLNQIVAADPAANTWLVANAGSGKTRVLTDRVARLLLGGADPMGIICLTYTKAAAAEMQNRLFKTLGGWAMAPDENLRADLAKLGEDADLSPERLARARQLFAKAIETPGGIRIQTIHSFCAALLRRFPLEAGVSPAFTEIDERSARLLQDEILEAMALGPEAAVLDGFLAGAAGDLAKRLGDITSARADFAAGLDLNALRRDLGLPPGLDEATVAAQVFLGDEEALLAGLLPILATGGTTDLSAHGRLAALMPLNPSIQSLTTLEKVLLNRPGTKNPNRPKIGAFPSKPLRPLVAPLLPRLESLMLRVEAARPLRLALALVRRTEALHHFAGAFLARYARAKETRGWLDFDDLIERATALLTDPALSAWVLYRLDGGISHVLVDEAQDTSPAQWRLIGLLTAEFTAGEGRHRDPRTLFVVGDKKQSIYSFQGADVAAFDQMHLRFRRAFAEAGQALNDRGLHHSFRSSPAILRLVDALFIGERTQAMGGDLHHTAFHPKLPGRVDFWPPVAKPEKQGRGDWFLPEDRTGAPGADSVLAGQVAAEIRALIDAGECIVDKGEVRPLHEGDFLILVRRRKGLGEEILRACKRAGLQVAGADRLTLTEELAVKDVIALLHFLNTPEDDLSLAAALRSPLFGASEAALFRLAHGRPGVLWQALRQSEELAAARAVLDDLRDQVEFLRPYELIDRILIRHRGRQLLLGRLGEEAAEALDELSSQALAYETVEVPSLTGFLVWLAGGEVEAKRQAETEGHRIRVMTVHGAKGLEAPVVILPDTADRRAPQESPILRPEGQPPLWALRKEEATALQLAAQEAQAARREAEALRLLYVAVTRARVWLIVAAAGEAKEDSWYGLLRAAGENLPLTPQKEGRLRHQFGDWPAPQIAPVVAPVPPDLPRWAALPAPPASPGLRLLSPSDLGGDKTLAGEAPGDPEALARGTLLHRMLELFPGLDAAAQQAIATALGATEEMVAAVRGLIADPGLAWVFGPCSLAEAGFAVPWKGAVLQGSIDRLVLADGVVTVVDFKSNAAVPEGPDQVPEGYLRQLGAYAVAMAAIYPGRRIETAILWTAKPQLMRLDPDIVSAALSRAAIP